MPDVQVTTTEMAVRVEMLQPPRAVVVSTGTPGLPGPPDSVALLAHINDPSPHPAYDDGIENDFVIFFENGAA